MSEQRVHLRYSDDVEKRRPDEDAAIDRIIAAMRRTSQSAAGSTAMSCALKEIPD